MSLPEGSNYQILVFFEKSRPAAYRSIQNGSVMSRTRVEKDVGQRVDAVVPL